MTFYKDNIFHNEFYPTSVDTLEQMQIDCLGKICLEPSAGKGDIIDFLKQNGASSVKACEIDKNLAEITKSKCGSFLGYDFLELTAKDVQDVELIVMNPPFSKATEHILHAYAIAPEGCEIIALRNEENKRNYNRKNSEVNTLIKNYGYSYSLGNCFSKSERQTEVKVECVHISKPILSNDFDFRDFLLFDEQEEEVEGIVAHNEIKALVNKYLYSLKQLDILENFKNNLEHCEVLSSQKVVVNFGYKDQASSLEEIKRSLKAKYWDIALKKMNIEKFATSEVRSKVYKFAEQQSIYPFSVKNIFKMMDIIYQTRGVNMDNALCKIVDDLTRYTNDNRYNVEGWKTNSGHCLNKKIIIASAIAQNGQSLNHYRRETFSDLYKVMDYVTGKKMENIEKVFHDNDFGRSLTTNTWYDAGHFEFKFFKKKTMHLKFKDLKDWELLNRRYAELKGEVLPEKM